MDEDWEKFKQDVKKYYPEYYHTLEWDEHPEDYNEPSKEGRISAFIKKADFYPKI